jgi:hypothetical protein
VADLVAAVYTAGMYWRSGQPVHAGCGRHRLTAISTGEQVTRAGFGPARVVDLLTGLDLCAAAMGFPELVALDALPGPLQPTDARRPR